MNENFEYANSDQPASQALRASGLTITPQHPGTKYIQFPSFNHPRHKVLHVVIT